MEKQSARLTKPQKRTLRRFAEINRPVVYTYRTAPRPGRPARRTCSHKGLNIVCMRGLVSAGMAICWEPVNVPYETVGPGEVYLCERFEITPEGSRVAQLLESD